MNYNPDVAHIITKIIKLELEVSAAVLNGHRPSDDDKFAEHRKRLKELRNTFK